MNEPLQDRIAALRSEGAWRRDPVRFRTMEALARRLPAQGEAVRALLHAKVEAAVAEFESAHVPQPAQPTLRRDAAPAAACAPLAQLNAHLRQASTAARAAACPADEPPHEHELASASRFRRAWHASRSVEQVERALARRPANAGPLNSHALVLHSLALMRELSPEYLRRFLAQVESLQWLELPRAPAATAQPRAKARAERARPASTRVTRPR
jgi:hypothetical protein